MKDKSGKLGLIVLFAIAFSLCLFVGSSFAQLSASGSLEITAEYEGIDVTSACKLGVVSLSGEYFRMFEPSGALLLAELPAGNYMCTLMYVSGDGDVKTEIISVGIRNGAVTRERVTITGNPYPDMSEFMEDEEEYGDDEYAGYTGLDRKEDPLSDQSSPLGTAKSSFGKSVDIDDIPPLDEMVEMAVQLYDQYYSGLSFEEQYTVDLEMVKLDQARQNEVALQMAVTEMTSVASVLAGMRASEAISVIMASAALMALPEDPLAVSNFGAILNLIERLDDAIGVLKYARILEPRSPVILTNLANCVNDFGDELTAELLYLEALQQDPNYSLALSALGDLYMEKGLWKQALEKYLKAAQYGYTARVGKRLSEVQDEMDTDGDDDVPPPPWSAGGDSAGGGSSQGGISTFLVGERSFELAQVNIPPMPQWNDYVSCASSLESLNEWMTKHWQKTASLAQSLPRRSSLSGMGAVSYDKQQDQLTYLMRYYRSEIAKISKFGRYDTFAAFTWGEMSRLEERSMQIQEKWMKELESASDEEQLARILKAWCEEWDGAYGAAFGSWIGQARGYYSNLTLLLEQFQQDSAPILTSIYSREIFMNNDYQRYLFIYNYVLDAVQNWAHVSTAVYLPLGAPCYRAGNPRAAIEMDGEANDPPPCPLEGKKLKIGIGPVSISLDCDTIGMDFGAGLVAGFDWNFKQDRITKIRLQGGVKVGAGYEVEAPGGLGALGVKTGFGASGGTTMGVELTFGEGGELSDVTGTWDSSVGVQAPGANYNIASSLVVGSGGRGDVGFTW